MSMTAALLLLLTAAPAASSTASAIAVSAEVADTLGAPEAEHPLRFFGAVEEEIRDGDDTSSPETAAASSAGAAPDRSSCERRAPSVDAWLPRRDEVSAHAARGPPAR